MRRYTTARRHVASSVLGVWHFGQRAVVPSCLAVLASCAPAIGYRAPGSVRGYDILVTRKDSLSREIGRRLKRRGYSVRSAVKGGGAPAAYLLWFTQRETEQMKGGLYIPDTAKEKPIQGEVLAVGPGRREKGELVPLELRVGDRVVYGKYSGTQVELEGEEIILIKESDVIAKLG